MIKQTIKDIVERFPRAAQLYRNSRDLLDRNSPSVKTPWGFSLAGHPLMASGTFEPEETQVVRELLQNVDILINIGANVGYYCCHALNFGKPVIAIEPIVRNLHYLMRNIKENGWRTQADIFPVALGAKADILEMWGGGTGASVIKGWAGTPESYIAQVPVLTLDRILGSSLDGKQALILVDIEGAEYAMLQGAMKTLRHEPRPIWMMEISSTTHQPSGITVNPYFVATFEQFFELGYTIFTADAVKNIIELKAVQAVSEGNVLFGTHNFLFQ